VKRKDVPKKDGKKQDESCVLCMEDFGQDDDCISLKCGHIFHSRKDGKKDGTEKTEKPDGEGCGGIQEWLEKNGTCPTCRETIE